MIKFVSLDKAAHYVRDKVNGSKISLEDFVSVDNLLPNKEGVTNASVSPKGNLTAFSKDDILVGNIRPYLKKIWRADRSGGCSPDVLVLRHKDNFHSSFLYYCLLRDDFFVHMMRGKKGTKMPRGDKDQILNYPIPDISFSVQEKIGSLLSSLDAKIKLNANINTLLVTIAKAIYDYWFVQFDFPDKNGKPYKASGGKMVWSEKLKQEIPEIWSEGTITELIDFNPKLPLERGRISSYIDMDALPESGYMTKALQQKPFNGGMKFQNGDVAMARITPCLENGKTGLITLLKDKEVGFGSTEFIILRGKNMDLRGFSSCLARSEAFRNYAISKMTGTSGRKRVSSSDLELYVMAIPDDETLKSFERTVVPLFSKMTLNTLENQKLTELREWLLPMLMNGQIRIKDSQNKVIEKPVVNEIRPANPYFYQTQLVAAIINASKRNKINHGEMTLAKYTYLLDKIYRVPTYFKFDRWHLGPYPKEMKKVVNNKKFFRIQNNEVAVVPQKKEYNYQFQQQVENAITELASIFKEYSGKERSRQTELIATVCKVIEDIQSTDFKAVRESMKKWSIKLETSKFKNKAEKFSEEETNAALKFIDEQGWVGALLGDENELLMAAEPKGRYTRSKQKS